METITLWRTGRRPLRFTGTLVAEAQTSPDRASAQWSGVTGRWAEARVYENAKGGYILYLIRRTSWQGERDEYMTWVRGSLEEVVEVLEREEPQLAEEIADELDVVQLL